MEIVVDSTRIRSAGATIKQQAQAFEALYNEIKNGIRNMSNNWKGSSAESFYNQFNQLSPSFDAYKLVLNEYGDFLVASAGQFETTEAKIGSETSTLRTDLFK
jgi:WXG100 family type VII secretion target